MRISKATLFPKRLHVLCVQGVHYQRIQVHAREKRERHKTVEAVTELAWRLYRVHALL